MELKRNLFCIFILLTIRNLKRGVEKTPLSSQHARCEHWEAFPTVRRWFLLRIITVYLQFQWQNILVWGFFLFFWFWHFCLPSGNAQKFIRQRPTVGHLTDWYKGHLSTEMENLIDLLCPRLLSIARAPHASHGLLSCQAMKNHQS